MTLYVAEFPALHAQKNGEAAPALQAPALAVQVLTPGASAATAAPFNAATRVLRVHTDAACLIAIGPGADAGTAGWRMAPGQTEYFGTDSLHVLSHKTP